MSVKIEDIMSTNLVSANPSDTIGSLKNKMENSKFRFLPVTGPDEEVLGVVSGMDILASDKDNSPVSTIMTKDVYRIPLYENVEIAARMMRNHKIHHLVVMHEDKLRGVVSSFDLLKLVEGKRFVMKNPSTPKKKGVGSRTKSETL
jgi:CBS domain-containing protein